METGELTISEIERGIRKLQRRLENLKALDPAQIHYDDAKVATIESDIRNTIRDVFGPRSPEFEEHQHHDVGRWKGRIYASEYERQPLFADGIPQSITMLEGLISRLEERREDLPSERSQAEDPTSVPAATRRVFVVHGRDDLPKERVARFLQELDLEPVILHEQPNQGRTIIEKLEGNADVAFALILLTPDDIGKLAGSSDESSPRARQNVVFELGYFVGKLGRNRVCALHQGNVELPSDYDGIVYVPMDIQQAWRLLVARELQAVGIAVDLNRLL